MMQEWMYYTIGGSIGVALMFFCVVWLKVLARQEVSQALKKKDLQKQVDDAHGMAESALRCVDYLLDNVDRKSQQTKTLRQEDVDFINGLTRNL